MPSPPQRSPSALNRFLGCEYRTYLDILERRGTLGEERRPPQMQLLFERGDQHEEGVVAQMQADGLDGLDVVFLDDPDATREQKAERTLAAMRAGAQVLHQGCFLHNGWVGHPDFLIRVEEPSDLGGWSYEVADAKRGRTPQPKHIFQLLFYTEQLERLQGRRPARMRLLLGDGSDPAFREEDFSAYAAGIRELFQARLVELEAPEPPARLPLPGRRLPVLPVVARLREEAPRRRPPLARREPPPRPGAQARRTRRPLPHRAGRAPADRTRPAPHRRDGRHAPRPGRSPAALPRPRATTLHAARA